MEGIPTEARVRRITIREIELDEFTEQNTRRRESDEQLGVPSDATDSLPPADHGKDAWLLLAASFMVEGLVWGYLYSYGIFQEYYSSLELFEGQRSLVPVIGATSTGIAYLSSPIMLPILRTYPYRKRQIVATGLSLLSAAHLASSFAKTPLHLVLTQGVLTGIGSAITYYPVLILVDEWFIHRKSFAYGIAWASSGLFGIVLPYLLSALLSHLGFRTTLRIWTFINLALIGPGVIYLKPRLPQSSTTTHPTPSRIPRLDFALHPRFLTFFSCSLIVSLGAFFPSLYLPSYALSLNFPPTLATSTASVLNGGAFIGFVVGGIVTQRFSRNTVMLSATFGATLSILIFWGLSTHGATLIVFALVYSFFASVFIATWPSQTSYLMASDRTGTAETSVIYGLFIFSRGIGNLVAGPLSQVLLNAPTLSKSGVGAYGGEYGVLILFAAATAAWGGVGPLGNLSGFI